MRYYAIYEMAGGEAGRDRLVDRRVCRLAAEKLARRLERENPGKCYYHVWNPPLRPRERKKVPK